MINSKAIITKGRDDSIKIGAKNNKIPVEI